MSERNTKTNHPYRSRITRHVLFQYFLSLIGFVIGLCVVVLLGWQLCASVIWQPYDPLYQLLSWIRDYILLVGGVVCLVGWTIITYYFMSRPLRYLDQVVAASGQLVNNRNEPIVLPESMKNVQDELNLFREQAIRNEVMAKEAEQRKNDLIVYLAHDLKTPLTVIRGYAQAFEDGCVPPEKAGEYLRAMKEKTDEASQLIDSLFLYAKTNHPSYSPQLVRMDVCEAVRRIAVEMLPTIEQRACRLDAAIPDDPIWVRADGSLLARVLGNLINNACVHNPGGVTVRLTCKRTESEAVIAVADDGAGIPESIRDHVFEPFVTSNDARESGKGTGLGLSIAKRFIDLQGGTIAVSARPEEDFETEIVVTLPLA